MSKYGLGIMQGRLLPKHKGKYQAHPLGYWQDEFLLAKELNLDFSVQATGYQLEQREFFLGFTGIKQNLKNNQRMSSYTLATKLKIFLWYTYRTLKNPAYINGALLDNFNGYLSSFIKKENSLHLFKYIEWNEKEIEDTLKNEYGWISDKSYGKNQWRAGDSQTAFNNFINAHTLHTVYTIHPMDRHIKLLKKCIFNFI